MNVRKLIEDYLEQARLMQLATARDNQPWACSVYFAYDQDLNLYWISRSDRRHSHELMENSKVAGAIVLPHTPGEKGRGIQFQGIASKSMESAATKEGLHYYAKRYNMPEKRVGEIIEGKNPHVCYVVQPTLYVLFDEVNYPDNPRQEYSVAKE